MKKSKAKSTPTPTFTLQQLLDLRKQSSDGNISPLGDAAKQQLDAELEVYREKAKRDKLFLANEVLGYTFQPDVHTELFAIYPTFDSTKPVSAQVGKRDRLILWPRGHYKSTSLTVEAIQLILNFPDIRIALMRSTLTLSEEWLNEIMVHFAGEVNNSYLPLLFPEFCGTRKQLKGTKGKFIVPCREDKKLRQPTATIASSGDSKSGKHFDVIMFDDLVTDQNYSNPAQVQKIRKAFNLCFPLLNTGGYRYVAGTRYVIGDLYEHIIEKNVNDNWVTSIKTCWTDDGKGIRFPERTLPNGEKPGYTREKLNQLLLEDPLMFACHYLNEPSIGGDKIFDEGMLLTQVVDPLAKTMPALYEPTLFVDLAASKHDKRDHSVVILGLRDMFGKTYVVDVTGGSWGPDEIVVSLIQMTLQHRPVRILIEGTAAGKYFIEFARIVGLQHGLHLPLDTIKVDSQIGAKNLRITALRGDLLSGRLKFFPGLQRWDKIVKEFTEFRADMKHAHDDYPDTIGLMMQHFRQHNPLVIPRHPILTLLNSMPDAPTILSEPNKAAEETCGDDWSC